MSIEQYLLTTDQLIIRDPELGIDLSLPFSLPRLPDNLEQKIVPIAGAQLITTRDAAGGVRSAYLIKEGRRVGECRTYIAEGKLQSEMFYLDGKLHGPSTQWGSEGQLLAKSWYCEGKKVGKAHLFYASGQVASVQRFKAGEWDGVQEYFYEQGAIKSLLPFKRGKLHGEVRLFWENGQKKRSVLYSEGMREGWDRLWNESEILIDEGEYQTGHPVGKHCHFFADGKLQEELFYHTPARYDRREWNATGKLIFEGIYAADLTYTEKVFLEPHGAKVRKGYWDGKRLCWK